MPSVVDKVTTVVQQGYKIIARPLVGIKVAIIECVDGVIRRKTYGCKSISTCPVSDFILLIRSPGRLIIDKLTSQLSDLYLTCYRRSLVANEFCDKVGCLLRCAYRCTPDAYLRQKIILTRLTPATVHIIVPCAVKSPEVNVRRDVIVSYIG